MSNNLFYKALAAVSTAGIVAIAGIQVSTAFKKGNNADDQLAKTIVYTGHLSLLPCMCDDLLFSPVYVTDRQSPTINRF